MLPGFTIDGLLKNPAAAKEFTLYRSDRGWQCSVKRDGNAWNVTIDPDPATAVIRALIANRNDA